MLWGGSYLGWGWGDAAPHYGEGRLTLMSFKSLLAVSTDTITSTSTLRGQRALPVGSVTRAGSQAMEISTPELPETSKVLAPLGTSLTEKRKGESVQVSGGRLRWGSGWGSQAMQTAPHNSWVGEPQGACHWPGDQPRWAPGNPDSTPALH